MAEIHSQRAREINYYKHVRALMGFMQQALMAKTQIMSVNDDLKQHWSRLNQRWQGLSGFGNPIGLSANNSNSRIFSRLQDLNIFILFDMRHICREFLIIWTNLKFELQFKQLALIPPQLQFKQLASAPPQLQYLKYLELQQGLSKNLIL